MRYALAVLQLEVLLAAYGGASALVAPRFWLSSVLPQAAPPTDSANTAYYRHVGPPTLALAAALQLSLVRPGRGGEVLRLLMRALLVGDVAQLFACWQVHVAMPGGGGPPNYIYAVLTAVFMAARLIVLRSPPHHQRAA